MGSLSIAHLERPPVVLETSIAGDDTNTSTRETVRRMAGYIRKAIADPGCQAAAEYAWRHFAGEQKTIPMLAWAAFWYTKHCVKFRLDEGTMQIVGRAGEFDLLIAPDVLVRMKDPAEDCDGFTMFVAALFAIMASWFYPPGAAPADIATVAAGADDPERWSHVFAIAETGDGQIIPLDASHGPAPGLMARDIYRFQAWNLEGEPVALKIRRGSQLHGLPGLGAWKAPSGWTPKVIPLRYGMGAVRRRRRRGMGQDDGTDSFSLPSTDTTDYSSILSNLAPFEPSGLPTSSSTAAPAATSAPFNWSSFLTNLTTQAAGVAKVAEAPMTTYTLPNGTVITTPIASSNAALASSFAPNVGGLLPILGIGLLLMLVFSNKPQ